jgi:hypothetical protein
VLTTKIHFHYIEPFGALSLQFPELMQKKLIYRILLFCILTAVFSVTAYAGAVRPGFNSQVIPPAPNPGGVEYVGPVPLGFTVNLFGTNYNSVYIDKFAGDILFSNAGPPNPTYLFFLR